MKFGGLAISRLILNNENNNRLQVRVNEQLALNNEIRRLRQQREAALERLDRIEQAIFVINNLQTQVRRQSKLPFHVKNRRNGFT